MKIELRSVCEGDEHGGTGRMVMVVVVVVVQVRDQVGR
jgi:hypothetical protein